MSQIDRAKEEVERIAAEMRKGAENLSKDVKQKMASQKTIDYSFGNTVNQLRIAQLVTLGLQGVTLFMESDRIGLFGFFLPFIFIIGNLFLSGKRWYNEIDGRYDAQQLVNVSDPALKAQYAIALFGGLVLAIITHFATPTFTSGFASFMYHIADYGAIATSIGCAGLECFEGLRGKLR
uniref:Uncharacterized protein n=1 Tax=Panagrolaimus sp. PS1159 TaxID=55785 RepID=A0AC35FVF7_9BILA